MKLPGKNFRERELIKKRCTNTIRKILALHPKERDYIINELQKSIANICDEKKNNKVTVLFAREDSLYKALVSDVYDIQRDARNYKGPNPVIAHPPCRAWATLAGFAKPRPGEKALAIFALNKVREFGGVLEHPFASTLWKECNLPDPAKTDEYGGYTLVVNQCWYGHRAEKKTKLYIVGCPEHKLPSIPRAKFKTKFCIIKNRRSPNYKYKKEIGKAEREQTPYLFAKWLIEVAQRCTIAPTSEPSL